VCCTSGSQALSVADDQRGPEPSAAPVAAQQRGECAEHQGVQQAMSAADGCLGGHLPGRVILGAGAGHHSVGVQRQCTGTAGRIENDQIEAGDTDEVRRAIILGSRCAGRSLPPNGRVRSHFSQPSLEARFLGAMIFVAGADRAGGRLSLVTLLVIRPVSSTSP
jgi:hypothetical protein